MERSRYGAKFVETREDCVFSISNIISVPIGALDL